ncbi:hypothetical protein D3C85_934730 [compost metagenome]
MERPEVTPEMTARAHAALKRTAELEEAGLLTRITGFGQLTPQEQQAVANGTYEAK